MAFAQKVDQKRSLGTTFSTKNRIFGRFGGPWGGPWGGLGEDFEEKILSQKKSRKKEVKGLASAGHADPGKEGFRVAKWPSGPGPTRLRPAGGAGGLFTLRASSRGHMRL